MQTYQVKRPHQGDRFYNEGDTREALPGDVAHLVRNGVLSVDEARVADGLAPLVIPGKAEPALPNKAERPLRNKAG